MYLCLSYISAFSLPINLLGYKLFWYEPCFFEKNKNLLTFYLTSISVDCDNEENTNLLSHNRKDVILLKTYEVLL